jgi:MFS family permease
LINLVLEPIRLDLKLNDTQMGLLIGPAFILLYALASLPIGKLADQFNRVWIMVGGMALWSACTALSGLSHSYPQLLAARLGVGLGEAALMPCVASILADYFARDRLGGALGVFSALSNVGQSTAMILSGAALAMMAKGSGHAAADAPWHVMFLLLAAPSLVLCPLVLLTVREPTRRTSLSTAPPILGWAQTLEYLWARRLGVLGAMLGLALINAGTAGNSWVPTFFVRTYGWRPADVALVEGPLLLVMSPLAIFLGGLLTDILRRRGREDSNLLVAIVCVIVIIPCSVMTTLAGNPYLSLGLAVTNIFFCQMSFGVIAPAVPLIVPPQMRGQVLALSVMTGILISQGLGPLLISFLTQYLFKDPAALKYSMALIPAVVLPFALLIMLGVRKAFVVEVLAVRASYAAPAPRSDLQASPAAAVSLA